MLVFSNSVFLFLFLPIVLLGNYILHGRARNYWLCVVSLIFYAWSRPKFIVILLASISLNYFGALLVEKVQKEGRKFFCLTTVVSLNILMLFYFKYFNFTMDILENVLRREFNLAEVILPVGISFFTFQGLSYVVDVYRGEVAAQRNPFMLGMYISFFPQLVAGPIVRYKDIAEQIDDRTVKFEDFLYGVRRFIVGLFKKVIIADSLAVTADAIFTNNPTANSTEIAWLGVVAYTLQLFFDFSGYSDMAIGMGRMFGFHFLENFEYPYISKSITEFWRRWHMSLSSFFRDYVYIPLGGNRKHVYLNVAVVFLLTGIWHGANYTFIVWGIWHGFFNIIERIVRARYRTVQHENMLNFRKYALDIIAHMYTLFVVMIGWILFRAPDLTAGVQYILSLFGIMNVSVSYVSIAYFLDKWTIWVMIMGLLMSTPIPKLVVEKVQRKIPSLMFDILQNTVLLMALGLCILQTASNTYSAFIYFQF